MNKSTDCGEKAKTDWHDAASIAQSARVHINTVRYHWRRAWKHLDLPPAPCGFLDAERAARLVEYLGSTDCKKRPRRRRHREKERVIN